MGFFDDLASVAAASADEAWWVAHTRSRQEKALADELSRFGIRHYLPLCPRVTRSRRTRRVSRSLVPVFPCYLFFLADAEQRLRALTTNRIARTIRVVDQATLVHQLRQIERTLASGEPIARSSRLAVGDAVRVLAGPLMGVAGVVTRWRTRVRVVLNVQILGQSVWVEVDADTVERIEPEDRPSRRAVARLGGGR